MAYAAAAAVAFPVAASPRRVVSLDQCADQYVLALAPREAIAGLSKRADDPDAWLRDQARGLPLKRATLEALSSTRPDLVVRSWGGDERMVRALEARGARVVHIEDATDFPGVRANVRTVAAALDRRAEGEALIRRMDAKLAASAGAWKGQRALYYTPGGFTAGPGTLVDAMLRGAGLSNAARAQSFAAIPLEALALNPPRLFVLGFFDAGHQTRWDQGRHPLLAELARGKTAASLPGSILGCPAWFAADGTLMLARRAPR